MKPQLWVNMDFKKKVKIAEANWPEVRAHGKTVFTPGFALTSSLLLFFIYQLLLSCSP